MHYASYHIYAIRESNETPNCSCGCPLLIFMSAITHTHARAREFIHTYIVYIVHVTNLIQSKKKKKNVTNLTFFSWKNIKNNYLFFFYFPKMKTGRQLMMIKVILMSAAKWVISAILSAMDVLKQRGSSSLMFNQPSVFYMYLSPSTDRLAVPPACFHSNIIHYLLSMHMM